MSSILHSLIAAYWKISAFCIGVGKQIIQKVDSTIQLGVHAFSLWLFLENRRNARLACIVDCDVLDAHDAQHTSVRGFV